MGNSLRLISKSVVAVAIGMLATATSQAAVIQVPSTEFGNLYDAIPAAQNGDEIHVANNYNETLAWIYLDNKDISIISYAPDFSAPAAGAQWNTSVLGGVDDALLTISNGSVTVQGFEFEVPDGNVFFLNSGANLTLDDCSATSVTRSDTAVVKAPNNASDVNLTLSNCQFNENGRVIWLNSVIGDSSLTISNSEFKNNSSYPIEWRVKQGNHTFNMSDSDLDIINNRQVRLLTFNTGAGELTNTHATIDRCYFVSTEIPGADPGRSTLKIGGVPDAADPASTMTLAVTNSVFDLTKGLDNRETVALDTQDDTDSRRFAATFDHCTISFGGTGQCGFRLRENQSTIEVSNSIIDANGEGYAALRAWRGTIVSNTNLLNAANLENTATGQVIFSGNEIINQSAEFVDRLGGDLQLQPQSPALFAGEDLGIATDILGNPRPAPVATNPDLGAYEMNIASAVADWAIY